MPFEQRKIYSLDEARVKIRRYCAYQERSQMELRQQLLSYGLFPHIADELLIELLQEDFLNEERYAISMARGKANAKGWGPRKIELILKQKGVSSPNIKKAMSVIDQTRLEANLEHLARKKWDSLKGEHPKTRKLKTIKYLLGKGYGYEDCKSIVARISQT